MRLDADIFHNGVRQGDGPVPVAAASVTKVLDGIGSGSINLLPTHARTVDLLRNKRRAHLFIDRNDSRGRVELARMILDHLGAKDQAGGYTKTGDGPDNLAELSYSSVLLGRKYEAQTVAAVAADLLDLTTGWTLSASDASNIISARFDGGSAFKALQSLVQGQGLHMRQGATFNTLEIGAFGDTAALDNGEPLTIVNRETAPPEVYENDAILLIDSLTLLEDSEDIVNWLIPVGAGEGDAMLTLEKSTRSIATGHKYDVQSVIGPDGRTLYYIADSESIAQFSTIQKVGKFSQVTLTGTSETAQIAAANALYDASAAWLERYSQKFDSYTVEVVKPRVNLLPGDKIRLRDIFRVVDQWGELVDVRNIDQDMWIMRLTHTIGNTERVRLTLASVDRVEMDSAQIVIGGLEEIRVNNLNVKPYFSHYTFNDNFEIDSTHSATFELVLSNKVQAISEVLLRIVTTPFRATSKTVSSGGGSTETSAGGGASTETSAPVALSSGLQIPVGGDHRHDIASHTHDVTLPSHTHDVTIPGHTHGLTYGIQDDSGRPNNVAVTVNGTVVASGLDPSGTGLDTTLDITDEINGAATLQQAHSIVIACAGGQGLTKITLDVFETIQSVSVYT